jgi:hypothetical protein
MTGHSGVYAVREKPNNERMAGWRLSQDLGRNPFLIRSIFSTDTPQLNQLENKFIELSWLALLTCRPGRAPLPTEPARLWPDS